MNLDLLMHRIQNGDEAAFSELYLAIYRKLFGLVLRIVRDHGAAEEVVQDAFLQIWKNAGRYDPSRGVPAAWMANIARSRALDRVRSWKPAQSLEGVQARVASQTPSPEESYYYQAVTRVVDSLPPANRDALRRAFYSGYSHAEIAERFRLPLGTVKTRVRRGLELVARAMEQGDQLRPAA